MFRKHARKVASVLGVAMALALFLPKLALADEDDPPSVVARLAYSQGSVSFQPAGTEDWVDAGINRPITRAISCGPTRMAESNCNWTRRLFGCSTALVFRF